MSERKSAAKLDPLLNEGFVRIGQAPEDWRQILAKGCWTVLYMSYSYAVVQDLTEGHHSSGATVFGWIGLCSFLAIYLFLVMARGPYRVARWQISILAVLFVLATVLSLTLGVPWLVLLIYVSISSGVLLPMKWALRVVPFVAACVFGISRIEGARIEAQMLLVLPTLLGGVAMMAVVQMSRTMRELRQARATVAHLAANEERLRLARDLHDLLGHSLSVITLKSELAGRMLPDKPEQAAQQVADIERVSRQALVDVREAVSGFRRPTLDAEIAGARTALAAAGIDADLGNASAGHPDLPPDAEGALAWALREAVTNVVRHSGARRCEVTLGESGDGLWLTVADDGQGPERPHGNGLTGLAERLALADGRLETGRGARGGFRLRACVPLSRRVAPEVQPQP
ncbi:two-component system sensor histidine kinase DesK [Streptomyces olivoverticillatus]|uniref:Two-component system sensor histidine kinase DesK n=1 Tax=Streptomyces olivoverticillatus TaxID=66427 RepID=A0A7W7LJQ5_9ACTN|nr:sensor histidine kinase [Streptomyces olivoverticillatus]MBB4891492.1 two-component system sensor histidine kinase DesK [Streptomyces olivoverticillatus]